MFQIIQPANGTVRPQILRVCLQSVQLTSAPHALKQFYGCCAVSHSRYHICVIRVSPLSSPLDLGSHVILSDVSSQKTSLTLVYKMLYICRIFLYW